MKRHFVKLCVLNALWIGMTCDAQALNQQDELMLQQLQQAQRLQQLAQNDVAVTPPSSAAAPVLPSANLPVSSSNVVNVPVTTGASLSTTAPVALPASAATTVSNPNLPAQQMVVADQDQVVRDAAYKAVTRSVLPMSPEQIQQLHKDYNASQFAAETDVSTPPRPVASSKVVSLAPGATPPVIRLSQGFVSSLVFVDSTGAPWPIKSYDLGNPEAFNIQWDKKGHTLLVQATKLYTYGNLAVELDGLATPVMVTLIPGQKAVDYRADLRVQGLGPNAKTLPAGDGLPGAPSTLLLGVLDGVPPEGSQAQEIVGGNAQAWTREDKLYLRTRLTLLSPSWIATMTSADGTKAYELQNAPTLLASDHGKLVQLLVKRVDG